MISELQWSAALDWRCFDGGRPWENLLVVMRWAGG
jgi:hypothetical protein